MFELIALFFVVKQLSFELTIKRNDMTTIWQQGETPNDDFWDDSLLIKAYDEAMLEYSNQHNVTAPKSVRLRRKDRRASPANQSSSSITNNEQSATPATTTTNVSSTTTTSSNQNDDNNNSTSFATPQQRYSESATTLNENFATPHSNSLASPTLFAIPPTASTGNTTFTTAATATNSHISIPPTAPFFGVAVPQVLTTIKDRKPALERSSSMFFFQKTLIFICTFVCVAVLSRLLIDWYLAGFHSGYIYVR
jgi:hypothetical protein